MTVEVGEAPPTRKRRRALLSSPFVAMLVLLAAPQAAAHPETVAPRAIIHRDAFGVPHIEGPDDASVVFGLAYAQAEDNLELIEDSFIRSLGRASEVHGEITLQDDQMVLALDIPRLALEEYNRSPDRMKAIYDAYANGLNLYVDRHQEEPLALLERFEPWYPLALLRYKYYLLEFVGYAGLEEGQYRPNIVWREPSAGSNAWAVAPSRTTSGAAMLFINPHVAFFGPAQYYEAHLISGEGWNFSGVGRFGFPFPYMGHNEDLGWAHTDNYPDIGDLYIEHFDDQTRPLAYRFGRGWRSAQDRHYSIGVRVGDGVETRSLTVRRTHHGPIVAYADGRPLTVRLSRLEEGGWFDEWYAMSKSSSLAGFRRALAQGAIAYMNVVYADRAGNIYYVYNGAVPRRRAGVDFRAPVDGSDPANEWRGQHPLRDMPQILNPSSGYILSTNSTPFSVTGDDNPSPEAFPAYMIGPETLNPRAQISHDILNRRARFSFDDWEKAAMDTGVWEARQIDELVTDFATFRAEDPELAARLAPLVQELESWDRRSEVRSVAMTVFERWYTEMRGAQMPTAPRARLALLDNVRSELQHDFGTWRVPWGIANRLQRAHWSGEGGFDASQPSLPIAGAPGWLGIVFNFYTTRVDHLGFGVRGNSYVSVVEFAARPRALAITQFGQSGRPSSPHYFDQAPLYARGEFREAWGTLEDVRANAVHSYAPGDE